MSNIKSSTKYDKKFAAQNILYYPWVGKAYYTTSPRVLILGESHYYDYEVEGNAKLKKQIDQDHYFTRNIFANQKNNVYTNTEAVLSNNLIDCKNIANKISFYNFFSHCLGYGPSDNQKIKYVNKYLSESQELFFKIIQILNPDIVIVWGTSDMWNWMPHNESILISDNSVEKQYYYVDYPNTKIIHIRHPSRDTDLYKTACDIKSFFEKNNFTYPLY